MYLIPIVLFILVWMWPSLWAHFTYGKIEVVVSVSKQEVNIGDKVIIHVRLRNRSWLPCPYVEVTLPLPAGLSADEAGNVKSLRYVSYLNLRQQLEIDFECYAQSRGKWRFAALGLQINEGFGLKTVGQTLEVDCQVVIVPAILPLECARPEFRDLLGRVEVTRWLHPDEVLLRGIREYSPGDSFKHVAWSASAKTGTWMTKQFSSSTERTVHLVLNGQFTDPYWSGTLNDEFDFLCDLVTTYATQFQSRGFRVEFSTNAWITGGRGKRFNYGEQKAQSIRSFLGRATSFPNAPFDALQRILDGDALHKITPVVIFTSFMTEQQERDIRRLARHGREIFLVLGPNASPQLLHIKGITVMPHLGAALRGRAAGES